MIAAPCGRMPVSSIIFVAGGLNGLLPREKRQNRRQIKVAGFSVKKTLLMVLLKVISLGGRGMKTFSVGFEFDRCIHPDYKGSICDEGVTLGTVRK
jgi:hypothetical protein